MTVKHNIRVTGCPNSLGEENPTLPKEECQVLCDWRINSPEHKNCSWVMASSDDDERGKTTSLRKMGQMLGMTHESVRSTIESALRKLACRQEEDLDDLVSEAEAIGDLDTRTVNNISPQKIDELMELLDLGEVEEETPPEVDSEALDLLAQAMSGSELNASEILIQLQTMQDSIFALYSKGQVMELIAQLENAKAIAEDFNVPFDPFDIISQFVPTDRLDHIKLTITIGDKTND